MKVQEETQVEKEVNKAVLKDQMNQTKAHLRQDLK
jgi:hypothetical protein